MGAPGISVAIIDEGCDLAHEDLVYKTPGYDAYDGDNNPSPLPADGHGTSCAGVAGAKANNAKGGAGVAPKCKILPVRIAKGIGGGFWDTTSAKVADGIRKAVDRGADVLSNSYGVGPSSRRHQCVHVRADERTRRARLPDRGGDREQAIARRHLSGPSLADDQGFPRRRREQRVGPAQEQDEPRRRELVGLDLRAGGRRGRPRRAHLHHRHHGRGRLRRRELHPRLQRHVLGDAARRRGSWR